MHAAFSVTPFGFAPMGSLFLASDGSFYGTAWGGGTGSWNQSGTSCNGCGTLVSFDPATDSLKKLFDFDYDSGPGGLPYAGPIQASNGKLYGVTSTAINNQGGAIYEFDPQTQNMTTRRYFGASGGYAPQGALCEASNGLLYGMTLAGGTNNLGVIFSYDLNNGTYANVLDFDGPNGGKPLGELIPGGNGLLYGLTSAGGQNNHGVLFSFNTITMAYTLLYEFFYSAGGYCPQGSLLLASNGKLYGLCSKGGAYNYGTLFEFDLNSATFYDKFDFSYAAGKIPLGSLIQASNGKLYGVTSLGGAASSGTLFEYDPVTGAFARKADFTNATGAKPRFIRLVERCTVIPETLVVTGPNIFTPNGDGVNDSWTPLVQYPNLLKELQFTIYNRWGNRIFAGDKGSSWNGNLAPDGTYYYVIQYTDLDAKSHSLKGFINLAR